MCVCILCLFPFFFQFFQGLCLPLDRWPLVLNCIQVPRKGSLPPALSRLAWAYASLNVHARLLLAAVAEQVLADGALEQFGASHVAKAGAAPCCGRLWGEG